MTRFGFSVTALATIVLGVLVLGVPSSQAGTPGNAPPANDDFADATVMNSGLTAVLSGRTTNATKQIGEPDHAGEPGGQSVWYEWTAPAGGLVTIETSGTDRDNSALDTVLGVYRGGAVGSLETVASNDDGPAAPGSLVRFPVRQAGDVLKIAVDSKAATQGFFTIELDLQTPSNDDYADATDVSGAFGTLENETNAGATKEFGETAHANNQGGASVWYRLTADHDGPIEITTLGSDIDTVLAVYTNNTDIVQNLSPVASNNDFAPGVPQSGVRFDGVDGTTYRIAVDGYAPDGGQPDEGAFRLSIGDVEPPETVLRKKPKRVLAGRGTVSAKIAFDSDLDTAEFECRLDGAGWRPCISPKSYSVRVERRPERHSIAVRATDGADNPDPSPAKASFKVVRR